jgi:hypothetical protein
MANAKVRRITNPKKIMIFFLFMATSFVFEFIRLQGLRYKFNKVFGKIMI